ncbi:MAG: alanine--tRNA ligase [Verrucomicrobiota bacterium]|jgi:alanyl-tRNA synthetase
MTSAEIRQSFLDFFKSKGHTIVPSASLMPDSPGLLFTNAGMNQFVPIFLNERAADVDKWPGAIPGKPTRAADTQKCIRAGGKHNDLEDVGLDTYHHTFFEMLGNWSFGDYFKKEAIGWAWELVTEVWKFPKHRLYATVYRPDKSKGDPSDFDQEAYDFWAAKFTAAGLDPKIHIVHGGKKDNFWMMGETGPCGPCSEIHVDLTPAGDTQGALVNKGDARCIEIWNLVFIQFNANPDSTFAPLPARHVDTGMGFERVTGIMQNTRGFTDFTGTISNYETDIFRPIFDKLEKLSGKKYASTLPKSATTGESDQEKTDVAFRVIADHIRTLSFSIADGILPGNTDRNYVLRRILRRAVRYGRTLGFHEPFFYKLVEVLTEKMGDVFPELRKKQSHVQEVIKAEEEAFNRTLDKGIVLFENEYFLDAIKRAAEKEGMRCRIGSQEGYLDKDAQGKTKISKLLWTHVKFMRGEEEIANYSLAELRRGAWRKHLESVPEITGQDAFELYDTYGFPVDLTELMAHENYMTVDTKELEELMEFQRARARAAQKKEIIAASNIDTSRPTRFVGFDHLRASATVLDAVKVKDKIAVTLDASPLYAEMGGQVGDTGEISAGGKIWRIVNTQKTGNTFLHFLADKDAPAPGATVELSVNAPRRAAIQRHHTVTHLLHWALHEVVSHDATQKGSYVGPDKLTFDFSSAAMTPAQVADVEKLVNERILENAGVVWTEVPYAEIKGRKEVMQFFGEKYGDVVRVVQIGGRAGGLDGYSMELCGGTHTRATGEIGLFRILGESAVAAGIRRIEAVAGLRAYEKSHGEAALISTLAAKVNSPVIELEKKIESLLAQQKDLEKQIKAAQQKQAAELARALIKNAQVAGAAPSIIGNLGAAGGDLLQAVADALRGQFKGVVVLGGCANGAVSLVASVSPDFTAKLQAGKIIQAIAPMVGGKGGGRPDNARGGGKDAAKLPAALDKAREWIAANCPI